MLEKDIREQGKDEYSWTIAINPHGNIGSPDDTTAVLSWNPSEFNPEGCYRLIEGFEGTGPVVVADMRTTTEYTVTGGNTDKYFTISWKQECEECFDFDLTAGWNLISLPLVPDNTDLSELFPEVVSAYGYENGEYFLAEKLVPGNGYWVKMDTDKTYRICGEPLS
ncbi:MAG: hypothetical protein GY751_23440, partial [Bacteroidetes bacterium]|nr:hypothetical protein [Bacteroidota bacterium]